ncbi:importin-9-like [Littorina saxatilis]|uniref:Importin N-terminal domain-containing protein n=1 Tax=Littorina saxatilis TaxID=31220 RepID=A0AAN9BDC7_9CAEN
MAGASGDRNESLKETVLESLTAILSPDHVTRSNGEDQIKALEVTEEFGVFLAEITVDPNGPLAIRQLASVLLKQYVQSHWSEHSDKFRAPETTQAAKGQIRQILPVGLSESISKVRSSVAYAVAAIAHWDWPEQWPELFPLLMQGLTSGQPDSVHGAMRVLSEFSQDITDTQMGQVAPIVLPELYKIFLGAEVFSVRTRSRAVHIFNIFTGMIAAMDEYKKSTGKQLLFPLLPQFVEAFLQGLKMPDGPTSDSGLKREIISALTTVLKSFQKPMQGYLPQILPCIWAIFTQSAEFYVRTVVNNVEDADDPVDSDGEVLGFENLVYSVFEFVHALIDITRFRSTIKGTIDQIIYYVIVYMQMTEDQIRLWSNNPDQFVEDEDEDSFSYSVRISAQDLLLALCSEFQKECAPAVCQSVTRHLQESAAAKIAGNEHWWKIHESCMLAMGSVQQMIVEALQQGKVQFHLQGFLQSVVLEDMNLSVSPFLVGRCLWTASRYTDAMDTELVSRFLQATVGGLHPTQHPSVRISAVRAVFGFCDHLKTTGNIQLLAPYLDNILEGLVTVATQFSTEVLGLCLETLSAIVAVDQQFTAAHENKIGPMAVAIFLRHAGDPFLVSLVQDVIKELVANPVCSVTIQNRILPTLSSILTAPAEKVSPGLTSVALDLLETVVRATPQPLSDAVMSTFLPAVHCTMKSDDNATMQSGGECLRAFASVATEQLVAFRDDFGNNGIHYLIQVINKLLDPKTSEHTATFVGRLVAVVIGRCGSSLGENLDLMLRSVLSKMQQTETLSVMQSLLMVFAHLVNIQLEPVLEFLTSVPGPTGKPALEFVLEEWCSRQHLFYGSYERKVSALALAKLLRHTIMTNDTRLQNIIVHGEPIQTESSEIRTRSKAKAEPEQWTEIPALVKMYKLLINELSNQIEAAIAKQEDADDDDDDDDNSIGDDEECFDGEEAGGQTLASLLEEFSGNYDGIGLDEEADDDPDTANDPINQVDLRAYLTEFLQTLSTENCYSLFTAHHNPAEVQVLRAININV